MPINIVCVINQFTFQNGSIIKAIAKLYSNPFDSVFNLIRRIKALHLLGCYVCIFEDTGMF